MAATASFSMRAYVESMRERTAAELGPLGFVVRELPPMEVRRFRWWEDELKAVKASEAEENEEEASGKVRTPKKRSISDLFVAAPPIDASGSSGAARLGEDEEEVLGAIMRRTKEQKRRRRLLEAAAAGTTPAEAEAEPSATGEARGDSAARGRQKSHNQTNMQDKMGTHESSSEELVAPDPNEKKHRKISNLWKIRADKQKYMSRKATKVGKQLPPLHSILKKYTKHTSVRMVDDHCNPKHAGVLEVFHKSVKHVKFVEANDVHGSNKEGSKMPQLESLHKLFSDAMTSSSSSTDISSEGDRHIAAESSSSHISEKASSKEKKANENTGHENCCKVSNTGSSDLLDLNEPLPEHTVLNSPYISNSEGPNHEHTQDETFSMDEQTLHIGRENQKHATDLDIREKGKSPALPHRTVHNSAHLQQSRCSMTLCHDISQLSTRTGGEIPPCQFQEFTSSQSTKPNFHSEMNVQEERRPAAGQTFRLMGKDLKVSASRNSYLPEISQKNMDYPDKGNLNAKMVLGLPRQGQPFLSLQAPVNPIVSVNTAGMVHEAGSNIQAQFGNRTQHNFSQPLPTANLFSGDLSQFEDRFRNSSNLESPQNILLGYPPLLNHGSEAFRQSSRPPWHYSDNSTTIVSPSETFIPAIMRRVTQSSDYHVNMHQSYGMYSASPSVRYGSFNLSNPNRTVQGVSDSRVSSALPSRYADTGVARAVQENSNASSSSSQLLRSGPVKLRAGAKHILIPSESTVDDNPAPLYSCVSFGSSNKDVSVTGEKVVDFRKF